MALAKSVNKSACGQVLVAHAYNPSYLEGWDQEDHGSKPAGRWGKLDPISMEKSWM
jgi:hypothetical protein